MNINDKEEKKNSKNEKNKNSHNLIQEIFKKINNTGISSLFKYFIIFILIIIGISVILAVIKVFLSSLIGISKVKYTPHPIEGINTQEISYGKELRYSHTINLERLYYHINIETENLKSTVDKINREIDKNKYKILSKSISKKYANLKALVPKEENDKFLKFIKSFSPKSINSNAYSLEKPYIYANERINELEKKKKYLQSRLEELRENYKKIINLAIKNNDARSLNDAYTSLYNQEYKIWKEIDKINKEIDNLKKEIKEFEEKNKYVEFDIYIYENRIINIEDYKEQWKFELKSFFNAINDTLSSIILGIPIFLVKAVKIIIYSIITLMLALGTLKLMWIISKKILRIKN